MTSPRNNPTPTLRKLLLALFSLGTVGAGVELLLLGHTEDAPQWIPLLLLAAGLVVLIVYGVWRRPVLLKVFRVLMGLFVAGGVLGLYYHLKGNMEFELEMYPKMEGWELFRESMTGATPALAPGLMIQLGLLGLVFTYQHPVLNQNHNLPEQLA